MKAGHRAATILIRIILSSVCRVHAEEVKSVPRKGPLIVVVNHINFLEVPLLYTYLHPRPQSSLVKAETWENPFLGGLADMWNAIPIRREGVDSTAFRAAERVLRSGNLLLVAPEGTRTVDGKLRRGKQGVVLLAAGGRVPVMPLVHFGGEMFLQNLRRGRRTDFTFRTGPIFHIKASRRELSSEKRQNAVDEIMGLMASLLPPRYRGYYEHRIPSAYRYLGFQGKEEPT